MFTVFATEPDYSTYTALPSRIPLDEMNPPLKDLKGVQRKWPRHRLKWTCRNRTRLRKPR